VNNPAGSDVAVATDLSDTGTASGRLDVILAEYLQLAAPGRPKGRETLIRRFPEFGRALRAFLTEEDRMERLTKPAPANEASATAGDSTRGPPPDARAYIGAYTPARAGQHRYPPAFR